MGHAGDRMPAVSVVMPVHNALPFLEESVAGILAQSFEDFELIILDDGSTDGSRACLERFAARDARIRLLAGDVQSGPVASSNRVVAAARAPLVARMDADDVVDPRRLERQVALMERVPDAVLTGSLFHTIDADGRIVREADYGRLRQGSPFPPFAHSTIMFRRVAFDRVGGYRPEASRWEDIDLYLRLAAIGRILVLTEPLAHHRLSRVNTRLTARRAIVEDEMDAMYRAVTGLEPNVDGRLMPQAFYPVSSIELWQGRSPGVWRRLVRRARLKPDLASLKMLIWAAWADLSPRSLRATMRTVLSLRNRLAHRRIGSAPWVEWRPVSAAACPQAAVRAP